MAKNSIDAYGAAGKTNLLMFDPDALTIVTDPKHPLFDPRGLMFIDEVMVDSIRAQGVIQPIVVLKNPETGDVEVVAGRRRVVNAREANRRLRAEGLEPITIPAWARRLDERTSTALMIAENEIRMDDPPIQKAEKMRRLVEGGRTVSAVAQLFGCSEQTVANFLRLLDAVAPVRDAVDAGTITATTARQVADLKPDQQREVVAKLAAVADQPAHKRAAAQREIIKSAKPEVAEPSKPTMRSKASIQARIAAGQDSPPVLRALRWVLGADA